MEIEIDQEYIFSQLKNHIITSNYVLQSKQKQYLVLSDDYKLSMCNSQLLYVYDLITGHIYSTDLFYPNSSIYKYVYVPNDVVESTDSNSIWSHKQMISNTQFELLAWSPPGLYNNTESYLLAIHSNPNISLVSLTDIEGKGQLIERDNFTQLIKEYKPATIKDINKNKYACFSSNVAYYHLYGCWNTHLYSDQESSSLSYTYLYISIEKTLTVLKIYKNQIKPSEIISQCSIPDSLYIICLQFASNYIEQDIEHSYLFCLGENNILYIYRHFNDTEKMKNSKEPLELVYTYGLLTEQKLSRFFYYSFVMNKNYICCYNASSYSIYKIHFQNNDHEIGSPAISLITKRTVHTNGIHVILPSQQNSFLLFDLRMNCFQFNITDSSSLKLFTIDNSSRTFSNTVISYASPQNGPFLYYYELSIKNKIDTLPVLNYKLLINSIFCYEPDSIIQRIQSIHKPSLSYSELLQYIYFFMNVLDTLQNHSKNTTLLMLLSSFFDITKYSTHFIYDSEGHLTRNDQIENDIQIIMNEIQSISLYFSLYHILSKKIKEDLLPQSIPHYSSNDIQLIQILLFYQYYLLYFFDKNHDLVIKTKEEAIFLLRLYYLITQLSLNPLYSPFFFIQNCSNYLDQILSICKNLLFTDSTQSKLIHDNLSPFYDLIKQQCICCEKYILSSSDHDPDCFFNQPLSNLCPYSLQYVTDTKPYYCPICQTVYQLPQSINSLNHDLPHLYFSSDPSLSYFICIYCLYPLKNQFTGISNTLETVNKDAFDWNILSTFSSKK